MVKSDDALVSSEIISHGGNDRAFVASSVLLPCPVQLPLAPISFWLPPATSSQSIGRDTSTSDLPWALVVHHPPTLRAGEDGATLEVA